uniref:DUF3631 domain-containing protein n=1 Tax=candidate division WOR-3 bacterium TaxID=2052148 RepID=A0A7V3NVE2_UNCW3
MSSKETIAAYFPGLIDLAKDKDERIVFLFKNEQGLQAAQRVGLEGELLVPPAIEHLPFLLPQAEEVIGFSGQEDTKLFDDVLAYLARFFYLPSNELEIFAAALLATYLQDHPEVFYLPVVLLFGPPERGKTRAGKAFTYASFRGIHVVDLREANLIRFTQNLRATLFLDFQSFWKKALQEGSSDILLLRYEKGAKVARVLFPDRGPFNDTRYFEVYGPTVVASNDPVHEILDTRCVPFSMPNRPHNYEVPAPEKAQDLRNRLTAWRSRMMDRVLPEVELLPGRFGDITKILLQVGSLFGRDFTPILREIGQEKKSSGLTETIEGVIIQGIVELLPQVKNGTLRVDDLLRKVNALRGGRYPLTGQFIGKKLRAMGFKKRFVKGRSEIFIETSILNPYLRDFGLGEVSLHSNGTFYLKPFSKPFDNTTNLKKEVESVESVDSYKGVGVGMREGEGEGGGEGIPLKHSTHSTLSTFCPESIEIIDDSEGRELAGKGVESESQEHRPNDNDEVQAQEPEGKSGVGEDQAVQGRAGTEGQSQQPDNGRGPGRRQSRVITIEEQAQVLQPGTGKVRRYGIPIISFRRR